MLLILIGLIGVVFVGVIIVAIWFVSAYNSLITFREQVKSAFSNIDVILRQRFDMIPQLVESAKGAMKFEKDTFIEVTKARNEALSALNQIRDSGNMTPELLENLQAKTKTLDSAFAGMKLTFENYPDLKSVETVTKLQEGIQSVENKITFSRNHYNQVVSEYQTKKSCFPVCLVAAAMPVQFPNYPYYDDSHKEEIKERPTISF